MKYTYSFTHQKYIEYTDIMQVKSIVLKSYQIVIITNNEIYLLLSIVYYCLNS